MTTVTTEDIVAPIPTRVWWLFLVTGILWIIAAFIILGFDASSAALIGYMAAFVLIFAGLNEFFDLAFMEGWKWLHAILGVLFLAAGIMALFDPFQIFGVLAILMGWYLLIRGTFETIFSIMTRHELRLWGFVLASGLIQIALGVWAIGYPGRSAALLLIWIGVGALMRGISEIFLAFRLKDA